MSYEKANRDFKSIDLKTLRKPGFLHGIKEKIEATIAKVNAGSGTKDLKSCPLCSSTERKLGFKAYEIPIYECSDCHLRYSGKIPSDLSEVYSDDAYVDTAKSSYLASIEYRIERFAKERIGLIRDFIGTTSKPRVLDIGCGTGWFLEAARNEGFEIVGQEFGTQLAKFTSERLGVPIHTEAVSQLDYDGKFDVITMFDLIEHVPQPTQLVKDCARLLKKDGILLAFTPNFDSLGIQTMMADSNLVTPFEHLTYFNPPCISRLAELVDMKLEYLTTKGIDLGDLKGYFEYQGKPNLSQACEELYDLIQPVIDHAGCGNHMRFVLRKG